MGYLQRGLSRALFVLAIPLMFGTPRLSAQLAPGEEVCCFDASAPGAIGCGVESADSCLATPGVPVPGVACCAVPELSVQCTGTPCYSGPPGTEGVGECRAGTWTCSEDGLTCEDEVLPEAETCDGLDNDCDGVADEGFDLDQDGFTSCGGDCDDSDPSVQPGVQDPCDGIDNDCDGEIDEDASCDDGRECTVDFCRDGACGYWRVECGDSVCTISSCSGPSDPTCECSVP